MILFTRLSLNLILELGDNSVCTSFICSLVFSPFVCILCLTEAVCNRNNFKFLHIDAYFQFLCLYMKHMSESFLHLPGKRFSLFSSFRKEGPRERESEIQLSSHAGLMKTI